MFTGKVIKRFRDKYTRKRFEVGQEYSHEDDNRLKELSKLGFVEYESSDKKPEKKSRVKSKK